MEIQVGIEIVNDSDEEVDIILPVGSIIEVDLNSGMQNIAISKDYRYVIPPRSKLRTQIKGLCLNRDLAEPRGTRGRITPFRYDSASLDQDDLWDRVDRPVGG